MLVALLLAILPLIAARRPPHLIIIVADDLGWHDVGFHGSNEVRTPNIDALAYDGIILNGHYSQALCTPSRAALLTAKYPIHTGMQHNVILEASPWGLPLHLKLMPQHLAQLGYESHAIGKWHLGFFKRVYTPTYRGFHSHYGFWNGFQDYYSHMVQASFSQFEGYDMRRNMAIDRDAKGKYTTRLLTERAERLINGHNSSAPLFIYMSHLAVHAGSWEQPLAAPAETLRLFDHIPDMERRLYLGMLWELDQSVARLIAALKNNNMLKDSIVVFISDNGAATRGIHKNTGSNYPLRGEKGTPWEGAVRTSAFVWSPLLKIRRHVMNHLFDVTDWLPTLYSAAGGNIKDLGNIDGVNQWGFLNGDEISPPRDEIIHNIDDVYRYYALRIGKYKYIDGTTLLGYLDDWVGYEEDPQMQYNSSLLLNSFINLEVANFIEENQITRIRNKSAIRCKLEKGTKCIPLRKPCLFDIAADPCEKNNLYDKMRAKVEEMEKRLLELKRETVEPGNKRVESIANPARWNNTWVNWGDLTTLSHPVSILELIS